MALNQRASSSLGDFNAQPGSDLLALPYCVRDLILAELVRAAPPPSLLIPQHRAPHFISGTLAGALGACKQLHCELVRRVKAPKDVLMLSLRQPVTTAFDMAISLSLPQRMASVRLADDVVSAVHWIANSELAAQFMNPTWADKIWIPNAVQSRAICTRFSGLSFAATVNTVSFSIPEITCLSDVNALANKLRLIRSFFPVMATTHIRIAHSNRACQANGCRRDTLGWRYFDGSAHYWCENTYPALLYDCSFLGFKKGASRQDNEPPFGMSVQFMKRGGNVRDGSNVCRLSFNWDA